MIGPRDLRISRQQYKGPFAWDLAKRGTGVFLAEYRGFGGLEGTPTGDGIYADGDAAVEAVREAGTRPERLVLIGRSLGTGVATELAVRHRCALLVLREGGRSAVASQPPPGERKR
jgi:fermentation-respiration switch protein FrsA (DUF1100 family)